MNLVGMKKGKEKEVSKDRGLVDIVLSWSFQDVRNKHLYKDQVQQIPDTFMSATHYLKSFLPSLIEEAHTDLASSAEAVSQAPLSQVMCIKQCGYLKDLFYEITLKGIHRNGQVYEPFYGDLIALTDVKPRFIDDLNRPKQQYIIAFVEKVIGLENKLTISSSKPIEVDGNPTKHKLTILSSKPIEVDGNPTKKSNVEAASLFAVYLTGLVPSIRMWNALTSEIGGKKMDIIEKVARYNSTDDNDCYICSSRGNDWIPSSLLGDISLFNLNESQKAAVMSCIVKSDCFHQSSVKLIWGPPGTGKTKTVACMLYSLLKMKCRTLTCAPTNIAVVEVATRVLKSVAGSLKDDCYRIGDMVLFGNQERLKIDDDNGILDIFLHHRVGILAKCLAPGSGWNSILESMKCLLSDIEMDYQSYLSSNTDGTDGKYVNSESTLTIRSETTLQDSKETNKKLYSEIKKHCVPKPGRTRDIHKTEAGKEEKNDNWTFEEFIKKRLEFIGERFKFCIVNLCKHLPTSFLSRGAARNMINALDLLKSFESLLSTRSVAGEGLPIILEGAGGRAEDKSWKIQNARIELLHMLTLLPQISIKSTDKKSLTELCLSNACLLFCTASGAAKLLTDRLKPVQMLVIDEAAQLKECESAIPLRIPGLRHAFLAGDERQLATMVTSQISSMAHFGRSLFERLVNLGSEKLLLNIQYRLHPSISLFPNTQFYNGRIRDAPNVKDTGYQRNFLEGNMFGSYSFINIAQGIEDCDRKSMRNMVEVAVIDDIVSRLFRGFIRTKKKLSVGVISPYKAQVKAIEERIRKHSADPGGDFSVNVRSVDGFQGGEEDVIIISTVRCNRNGNVGFLSNEQRVNVALTRARHCLWILGNEPTLARSRSIWKKLVDDAKGRRCYYNAEDDKRLSCAIAVSFFELGLHASDSRWKVILCDDFLKSIKKVRNPDHLKEGISFLRKLADGWRPACTRGSLPSNIGTSAKLLKQSRITNHLMLIWSVDILREKLFQTQVMRVWDILSLKDIRLATKNFEPIFCKYSTEKMQRCQYKCVERNLVVPMRWPVELQLADVPVVVHAESDSTILSIQSTTLNSNGDQSAVQSTAHNEEDEYPNGTVVPGPLFCKYSTEKVQICQYKCVERSLVVPMRWPVELQPADVPVVVHAESDSTILSIQSTTLNPNGDQSAVQSTAHNEEDENPNGTVVPGPLFCEYSTEKMQLCQYKCVERSLVVPMRWPVELQPADVPVVVHAESDSTIFSIQSTTLNQNGDRCAVQSTAHDEEDENPNGTVVPGPTIQSLYDIFRNCLPW